MRGESSALSIPLVRPYQTGWLESPAIYLLAVQRNLLQHLIVEHVVFPGKKCIRFWHLLNPSSKLSNTRYKHELLCLQSLLPSVTLTLLFVTAAAKKNRMTGKDQFQKQIDRLITSQVLHGSESLCKLLQYLAKHALDHPNTPLKEYQIATEVFSRRSDFDPQSDSTIRVQASRLRLKLAEYYNSEGTDDTVVVELPKGTYILAFHERTLNPKANEESPAPRNLGINQLRHGWGLAILAILLLAAVTVIGLLAAGRQPSSTALAGNLEAPPAAFRSFWKPFASGPQEPWVIFSNAAFVGRPETGMRYYNAGHDAEYEIWDHYTGVGEVLAVHSLDQVFGLFRRQLRVKRGSLFSLDDAKNNDLIFLGSPSENLTLAEIPSTHEFVFSRLNSGRRRGDLAILNQILRAMKPKNFSQAPLLPCSRTMPSSLI